VFQQTITNYPEFYTRTQIDALSRATIALLSYAQTQSPKNNIMHYKLLKTCAVFLLCLPAYLAAQSYMAKGTMLSSEQKLKEAHFNEVVAVDDRFFYTFGSETRNIFVSGDKSSKGNSFISKYDLNTLRKIKEWDLGELSGVRGDDLDLLDIIYTKSGIFAILRYADNHFMHYFKTQLFLDGQVDKPKEFLKVNTDDGSIKTTYLYAPDSAYFVVHAAVTNDYGKVKSTFHVFDERFEKKYSQPLQLESNRKVAHTIADIKLAADGTLYYITYEENPESERFSYMADISTNRYHLYTAGENKSLFHHSFESENEVYHGLNLHFDKEGQAVVFGFYSDIESLDQPDEKTRIKGLMCARFESRNLENPTIKRSTIEDEALTSLIMKRYVSKGVMDAVASAGAYQKSYFDFPSLTRLENGDYLLIAEHQRYIRTAQNSQRANMNLAVMRLSETFALREHTLLSNAFSLSNRYFDCTHQLVKSATNDYVLIFDAGDIERLGLSESDYDESERYLIGVKIDRFGKVGSPQVLLDLDGELTLYTALNKARVTQKHELLLPLYPDSGYTLMFGKFPL
jgi:hypothetical protein